MGFDPKAVAAQLLETNDASHGSLDPATLEKALKNAFEAGRASAYKMPEGDERSLHELLYQELMEKLPEYIYFKDTESRFIAVSRAQADQFGVEPEDMIGKSDRDFFAEEDADRKRADEIEVMESGEGWSPRVEHHFIAHSGERWALSTKHPWRDASGKIAGTFGHSSNITARMRAERALEEHHRLLETLIDVLPCRIFIRDREHNFRLLNTAYRRGLGIDSDAEVAGKRMTDLVDDPRAEALIEEDEAIMRTGVPVLHRVEFDTSPVDHGKWLSVAKVPLRNLNDEIEGIVGVSFDISAQRETERRARAVGNELAHKNQQIESELALARRLQVALATFRFPQSLPLADGMEVRAAYLYEPSEHLAGDFFQLLTIDDHRFGAFICDVMGHGVRSALVTAVIRGLIEEHHNELADPSTFFSHLNKVLYVLAQDPDFPRFVTAAFALFDTEKGTIELANAGHPPIVCNLNNPPPEGEKRFFRLNSRRDPALGLIENFKYHTTSTELKLNANYLFYTDGIIEQRNQDGKAFGHTGLEETLSNLPAQLPGQMITFVRQALEMHSGTEAFEDDVCAMALSVRETGA